MVVFFHTAVVLLFIYTGVLHTVVVLQSIYTNILHTVIVLQSIYTDILPYCSSVIIYLCRYSNILWKLFNWEPNHFINLTRRNQLRARSTKDPLPFCKYYQDWTIFQSNKSFFDETHCSNVAKLDSAPSISEPDCQQLFHKPIFDCLLETYSDGNNTSINWYAFNNQYVDDAGESCDADKDVIQDLTSLEFKQDMKYINFHYQTAHWNNRKSRSYHEFHCLVWVAVCVLFITTYGWQQFQIYFTWLFLHYQQMLWKWATLPA